MAHRPELEFVAEMREGSTDPTVWAEVWDEDVYRLRELDLEGAVVVDVGANCGAFTVAALVLGAQRVLAIEPDPRNLTVLQANVERWWAQHRREPAPHVVTLHAAAGLAPAKGHVRQGGGGGAWVELGATGSVPVDTLPALLDLGVDAGCEIDLLKVDTEGAEYSIVAGCDDATLARVKRLVMEWHNYRHAAVEGGDGMDPGWPSMMARLGEYFALDSIGRPSVGGMLYAWGYR